MKACTSLKAAILSLVLHGVAASNQTSEEISDHINISKSGVVLSNPEFSIDCVSCSAIGDISFSGGCDAVGCIPQRAPDANFSMIPFDFTEYWLGMAVDDFKVHVELNINLTPSHPSNEITIPLIGKDGIDFPFDKGGPFSTDFKINPEIHGWVNSTSNANFTYGFDIEIPPHSAVMIPVAHLDNITTYGFPNSTITPTNFISSNANLEFDFELSFRFLISLEADFLGGVFSETLTFYADVPNINLAVTQAQNVTSNCEFPAAGTDRTHIYRNLTHVVPTVTYDLDFNISHVGDLEIGPFNGTSLATSCLDYSTKSTGLVPAPSVNPESSQASISIPSFVCLLFIALMAIVIG